VVVRCRVQWCWADLFVLGVGWFGSGCHGFLFFFGGGGGVCTAPRQYLQCLSAVIGLLTATVSAGRTLQTISCWPAVCCKNYILHHRSLDWCHRENCHGRAFFPTRLKFLCPPNELISFSALLSVVQFYYQLMHLLIKYIHSSHLKPHALKMSVMPN
jgi:hypothetical protein